jgi:hypothetical protein
MSYCAPGPESYPDIETSNGTCAGGLGCVAWISPRGWQELVNGWFTFGNAGDRRHAARARPTRARTPLLHVSGFLLGKRLEILDVFPTTHVIPDEHGTSGYSLVAVDAAGHVRARRPLQLLLGHIDPDPGQPALPIVSARGALPAAGVAKVEFVDHGHVDDSIRRPASPPHVKLLTPRHGKIRPGRFVVIRWTPRARPSHGIALLRNPLTVMIDFSRDGGRHYRTLLLGRSTGRVKLRRKLFGHTKNGRLRIRVSDGFRVGVAVSARLSV